MPRYYLHIHNAHGDAQDDEGVEAASLSAASEIAISGIRDLLAAEARNGTINLNGRIDISDEDGKFLLSVPFARALTIQGAS
ncbi:MAG: hypothetical protein JO010_13390 [Alphaproteobacteria bacterium]|nr:hypothetical protein [Alphaproteobacteria bacterium]